MVDPIDGTRAFVNGRTDWSVAVALVDDGRPVIAAIYAPAEGNFYRAGAGTGTTLNGRAITASAGETFDRAVAAGPKPTLERLSRIAPTLVLEPKVFSLALRDRPRCRRDTGCGFCIVQRARLGPCGC